MAVSQRAPICVACLGHAPTFARKKVLYKQLVVTLEPASSISKNVGSQMT